MSQQRIPIYIPTYINNATYQPARVLPRLLFYNGNLQCEKYYIQEAYPGYGGISQQQFYFPYFDNYNVVSGSFPTTDSKSLLFNNEAAVYGELPTENLYTTYWQRYIDFLYDPITRVLNCKAIIPLADYFKMSLNDIVNFKGNYWHLRAINNYSLKSGDCDLQLLGPIISDVFSSVQPEPTPPVTGSTAYSTASINLNELNSGSIFIDGNLIVSGSPYYFSGNFTQYVSGGAVGNVVMEGKSAASTAWGGYTTASATLTIRDNGTLITSSTQYIYSGSTDTVITIPTTFTAGHTITISGSTAIVGNPTPPTTATLAWSYSVLGGPTSNGMGIRVNSILVESRTNTSSGTRTVNVGDTISVTISCNGCSGGSDTANAYCSGIINDAACTFHTANQTLNSYTYTVTSGDIGTVLSLDSFALCAGGCY